MADLAEGFSPKQFQLAIAAEADGIGGGEATDADYKFINIDSIEFPSLNPQQVLDVRHGVGRTMKAVDMFLSNKLTVKEISFSGIADATILPMLLSNITSDASSAFEIAGSYAGIDLSYGDSVSDNTKTFAVVVVTPEAAQQMYFKGCFLTSLTISGDVGEEAGRLKISGTFKSGCIPALNDTSIVPTHDRASFNTNYFMTDYDHGASNGVMTIAGLTAPVMKSFSLTIENDVVMSGYDAAGNYQQMHRGIPEVAVTFDAVVKYDGDTDNLIQTFGEQSTSTVANTLTASDGVTRNVDISLPTCILTDVSFSEEDAMFLSVSSKAVAGTSGNIVSITIQ
tara:strand:+ start:3837 stop:4853 length:1017 start_codon:yes stop_codon:yes gene_type:complete